MHYTEYSVTGRSGNGSTEVSYVLIHREEDPLQLGFSALKWVICWPLGAASSCPDDSGLKSCVPGQCRDVVCTL